MEKCYKCDNVTMIDSCICQECSVNAPLGLEPYCANCEEWYNDKESYESQVCAYCGFDNKT